MSSFAAIDLSRLAAPDVVEPLSFEAILATMKEDFATRAPEAAAVLDLESEPLVKLLESAAYSALHVRARVNDAARAVMLAYAQGADLDNLAALFGVKRQVVSEGEPDATPPVPPTSEHDKSLRRRVQLALEGISTAGSRGGYVFHGLSADPDVKDISVTSPEPGQVEVAVLSAVGDGAPGQALLSAVTAALNDEDVRPLTDRVTVRPARIIPYQVAALLTLDDGPEGQVVQAAAEVAVSAYVAARHRLGHNIARSGLYAALHRPGVKNVVLTHPGADIICRSHEAARCEQAIVDVRGRDA